MRISFLAALLLWAITATAQDKLISLDDIWRDGTFSVRSVPGFNGLPDGEHYTELEQKDGRNIISIRNLRDGKITATLYNGKLPVDDYIINKNQDKLLLLTAGQHIYRRSVLYRVYVYDVRRGTEQLLDSAKVLHATFSPDGSRVAFVKDNNLLFKELSSGDITQVTRDGKRNAIINGNCDWVYEEEFEFTRAYEWAPDSRSIAYYRFDETQVPEFTLLKYDSVYPAPYHYKYPVAGARNSDVSIFCYDLQRGQSRQMKVTAAGGPDGSYIPRIKWTLDPERLCIYSLNRRQNDLRLLLADRNSGEVLPVFEDSNKAYIEINDNLQFLPGGASFLFNSERDGWNHLYIYNWKSKRLTLLTPGAFDIDEIVGVDAGAAKVYYTAATPNPMQRQLFVADFDGKNTRRLTAEEGTHSITGIAGNRFFLDRFSALNAPPVFRLLDAQGKVLRTLEDNASLKKTMGEYKLGKAELIQVEGAAGVKLNAWRMLPPDFDAHKKYPVLLYQYSGPGSQEAADRFPVRDYFWHQMLAQKGYIVVCADGTGTGFRGEAFRKKTYLQLGKYESDDQIAVAKYLATLPYVDKSRIGIWGWSYGGFMSSTCILKGADVFKMAIAVAPVTNWRYYDNIYTERYMRLPQENPDGYDSNAPEKMASLLKGKFLLLHGTGDDNVHFLNSVMLVNNLIKAGKEYDSEYYPNRTHGISGGNTRRHLYRRMTDFILDNL
jgi:dipeptidyl-peptidase-4